MDEYYNYHFNLKRFNHITSLSLVLCVSSHLVQ